MPTTAVPTYTAGSYGTTSCTDCRISMPPSMMAEHTAWHMNQAGGSDA